MSWVKVCGLTREADVAAAVAAGVDALGFVLAESSPRCVDVARARFLMQDVPALRILVTVDTAPAAMAEMVAATGADGIQPHGRHAAATARRARDAGLLILRPLRAGESEMADQVPDGQIPLLDAASGEEHGGTGKRLDWRSLKRPSRPFVLAGGLGPDNVASAIAAVAPWGVDASTGLERAPGIKDPARVAAFVAAAKES